jgi:hypothetical protein
MSEEIDFRLRGKVDGVEITPRTIGLSQFNEFNQQVEAFIAGREKLKLDTVHVAVEESSYVLRVFLPAVVAAGVGTDLRLLARQDVLGEIDPRRAEVVQKWQTRAKANPDQEYELRPKTEGFPGVRITRETDYRVGEVIPWVSVEKYLFGQVLDMGGAQRANVHLRLDKTGEIVRIGSQQGYLKGNDRLYHKALLHVRAEQHFRTGDLRSVQLISFIEYQPIFDEEALARFADKGAEAWGDVPDAAAWVRELRES